MKILVINCGSSSLKYQLIDMEEEKVIAKGLCERIGIEGSKLVHTPNGGDKVIIEQHMDDHNKAVSMVLDALVDNNHGVIESMDEITAVGHRVVHGGEYFSNSVIIDDKVIKAIDECSALAPLHNPPNLIGIKACQKLMPNTPMVAVFDTAFHQTMPERAYLYAIPYELYEKYKIRKYGFHGTSHKYVANKAAQVLNKPLEELKIISCHLGNGASICAIDKGKCVDTSMGFTPLDGLVMGTRSGDIDPAVIEFLKEKENISCKEVINILNKKSGVFGISGVSSDFRDVNDARDNGNDRAKYAMEVFTYRVQKYIGAYAAALNGVDAIIFTAGVGENDGGIREEVCEGFKYLGVEIDKENNKVRGKLQIISTYNSKVTCIAIPTNEELMIARDTKELI